MGTKRLNHIAPTVTYEVMMHFYTYSRLVKISIFPRLSIILHFLDKESNKNDT